MVQRDTKSQTDSDAAYAVNRKYWADQRFKHRNNDTIAAVVLIILAFGILGTIIVYQKWSAYHTDQMRYNQIMEGSKDHAN
jgi:hypothetical protein